jgi:hypothetical protein
VEDLALGLGISVVTCRKGSAMTHFQL